MVDIHSHILWGIDDGAKTLEESVAMVKLAAAAGTTDIVATPHANPQYVFDPAVIRERVEELRAACGNVPAIHHGCDFHLQYENIQDALRNPKKYTIDHLGYLMVEFSDFAISNTMEGILNHLRDAGMTPVITHPERNPIFQNKPKQLSPWVENGCLVQVTAHSLLGLFGRKARDFAWELMEQNMVHFVASDAHDCEYRHPRLDEAYRAVADRFDEGKARRLFVENPTAVIRGEFLPWTEEPVETKSRKWYAFWK